MSETPQQPAGSNVLSRLQLWFNSIINPLREEFGDGKGEKFPTPAIIVFGSEDSGKSSLLNALIGMDLLPSKTGVCTRLPIEIQLRQGPVSVECIDTETNKIIAKASNAETADQQWLADVLAKANGGVGPEIATNKSVLVKVSQPDIVTLDFIDLPGLMSVAREGFPSNTPAVTRQRTKDYLVKRQNDSIMLLVCDANTPVIQTVGVQLVQELGLAKQTMAVLTRCDRVNPQFVDESVVATLEGRKDAAVVHLGHGYYATALQVNGRSLSVDEEANWFNQQGAFSNVLMRTGRHHLLNAIQNLFDNFIKTSWIPRNIEFLQKKIMDMRSDYVRLGKPIAESEAPVQGLGIQIDTLPETELLNKFCEVFQANVEASYQMLNVQVRVRNAINQLVIKTSPPAQGSDLQTTSISHLRELHQGLVAPNGSTNSVSTALVKSIIDNVVKPLSVDILKELRKRLQYENTLKINRFTAVEDLMASAEKSLESSTRTLRNKLALCLNSAPLPEAFLRDFLRVQVPWISNLVLAALAAPLDIPRPIVVLQEREETRTKRAMIQNSLNRCLYLETVMKNTIKS